MACSVVLWRECEKRWDTCFHSSGSCSGVCFVMHYITAASTISRRIMQFRVSSCSPTSSLTNKLTNIGGKVYVIQCTFLKYPKSHRNILSNLQSRSIIIKQKDGKLDFLECAFPFPWLVYILSEISVSGWFNSIVIQDALLISTTFLSTKKILH